MPNFAIREKSLKHPIKTNRPIQRAHAEKNISIISPKNDAPIDSFEKSETKPTTSKKGKALAEIAKEKARPENRGNCYSYVKKALIKAKLANLEGESAYMAADGLAKLPHKFKEEHVAPENLDKLPAGAIVVWAQGSTKHGHISIADGEGNEISDFTGRQRTSIFRKDGLAYGRPRVFMPKDS